MVIVFILEKKVFVQQKAWSRFWGKAVGTKPSLNLFREWGRNCRKIKNGLLTCLVYYCSGKLLCPIVFMWLVTTHFRHVFVGDHMLPVAWEFIVSWCCEFNLPIMWKVCSRTHTWFFKALVCLAQWQCKRLHSCMVAEFTMQNIVIAHGKAFSAKAERIVSALWLQKMNWPSRGGGVMI